MNGFAGVRRELKRVAGKQLAWSALSGKSTPQVPVGLFTWGYDYLWIPAALAPWQLALGAPFIRELTNDHLRFVQTIGQVRSSMCDQTPCPFRPSRRNEKKRPILRDLSAFG